MSLELIQWGTATKEAGEPTFYQVSPTRPAAACPRHLYQPRVNQESGQSPFILGVVGMCLVDPSIRSWSWKLLGKTNGCMWIPLRRNKVLYWQQNESSKNKVNSISSPLSSVLGEKLTGTGIISKVTPKRQVVQGPLPWLTAPSFPYLISNQSIKNYSTLGKV